jgi:hypothetical protein
MNIQTPNLTLQQWIQYQQLLSSQPLLRFEGTSGLSPQNVNAIEPNSSSGLSNNFQLPYRPDVSDFH